MFPNVICYYLHYLNICLVESHLKIWIVCKKLLTLHPVLRTLIEIIKNEYSHVKSLSDYRQKSGRR